LRPRTPPSWRSWPIPLSTNWLNKLELSLVRSGKKTDQGALFLDEIGDMPFALQAKLLCFLDQWTVRAVGSASEETVDVQVVSATNSSLEQAVADRRFRPDLLYRLRGLEITLPPLRQRSDFLQAVHSLLALHGTDCPISDETIDAMRQHNWPGNFRELKNFILRMILVANSSVLLPSDVARVFDLTNVALKPEAAPMSQRDLRKSRRDTIIATYRSCNGNVVRTARELGVSRHTIYRELQRVGIEKRKFRRSCSETPKT